MIRPTLQNRLNQNRHRKGKIVITKTAKKFDIRRKKIVLQKVYTKKSTEESNKTR